MRIKRTGKEEKEYLQAMDALKSWRLLYSYGLITDKERDAISEKINAKFGNYLSPLRMESK